MKVVVAANQSSLPTGNSRRLQILCVDDEATGLQFRKMVLEQRGFRVTTATNACEALRIFQSAPFDLVITDHLLGRQTSHDMIAEIRRIDPQVGIIVLSGMADVCAGPEGVDAFVSKADGPEALLQKAEQVLAQRRTRAISGAIRDVEAEKSALLLAAIVESSDDAIFAKTLDAQFMSWNNAAERMYGYKAEEVIGKPVAMLLPSDRSDEIDKIMQRLKRGVKIDHFETVRKAKDGHRVNVSLTISPIRDSSGTIIGASTIARDITKQKMAEESLRASERLAVAGRLAATLAHEINNPLEGVTNILYLLRRASTWDETNRKLVQAAEDEVEKIRQITKLTLGLHRESLVSGHVKVTELIENVLALYRRRTDSYGIRVERRFDSPGVVNAIAAELRQVFSNLIVNAVDALHSTGSKLIVHVRDSIDRKHPKTVGVRVVIADDGPGIPPDSQARIFEQFYTTKGEEGTGMGLWVTRGIVERYGGSIRFRSTTQPGHSGTVFSVFLPTSALT